MTEYKCIHFQLPDHFRHSATETVDGLLHQRGVLKDKKWTQHSSESYNLEKINFKNNKHILMVCTVPFLSARRGTVHWSKSHYKKLHVQLSFI